MGEQEKKLRLKLLVDKNANKVLFAEADKDFVDFLFHIISLPIGTIVKLVGLKGMQGSLSDLYKSIQSLDYVYMEENTTKEFVLNPKSNVSVPLLLLSESPKPKAITKLYKCSYCSNTTVTDNLGRNCSSCNRTMRTEVPYCPSDSTVNVTESSSKANGYVKGVMTYLVMDNLEVRPLSTISAISLLNKCHVKDIGSLVEKQVQIGLHEAVAILKASLETKAVLSAVFLGGDNQAS